MQRQMGQMSFADGLVNGATNFLSEVDTVLDWTSLEQELSGIYSSSTGRPSYPLLVLFKTLLLQQWYRLSDPGMEEAMCDRISFRRFVGLIPIRAINSINDEAIAIHKSGAHTTVC